MDQPNKNGTAFKNQGQKRPNKAIKRPNSRILNKQQAVKVKVSKRLKFEVRRVQSRKRLRLEEFNVGKVEIPQSSKMGRKEGGREGGRKGGRGEGRRERRE
ncbi:MAG: hypothetical protein GY938_11100 [Ketobacter sp.]|nr:hypothetical protein [Ketobacter sp.]